MTAGYFRWMHRYMQTRQATEEQEIADALHASPDLTPTLLSQWTGYRVVRVNAILARMERKERR